MYICVRPSLFPNNALLAVVSTLVLEFKVDPQRKPTVTVDNMNTCLRQLVDALQGSSTN